MEFNGKIEVGTNNIVVNCIMYIAALLARKFNYCIQTIFEENRTLCNKQNNTCFFSLFFVIYVFK